MTELLRPSDAPEQPEKLVESAASTSIRSNRRFGELRLLDILLYKPHLSNSRRAVTYGDGHYGNA